jgi:hypothetical protein
MPSSKVFLGAGKSIPVRNGTYEPYDKLVELIRLTNERLDMYYEVMGLMGDKEGKKLLKKFKKQLMDFNDRLALLQDDVDSGGI